MSSRFFKVFRTTQNTDNDKWSESNNIERLNPFYHSEGKGFSKRRSQKYKQKHSDMLGSVSTDALASNEKNEKKSRRKFSFSVSSSSTSTSGRLARRCFRTYADTVFSKNSSSEELDLSESAISVRDRAERRSCRKLTKDSGYETSPHSEGECTGEVTQEGAGADVTTSTHLQPYRHSDSVLPSATVSTAGWNSQDCAECVSSNLLDSCSLTSEGTLVADTHNSLMFDENNRYKSSQEFELSHMSSKDRSGDESVHVIRPYEKFKDNFSSNVDKEVMDTVYTKIRGTANECDEQWEQRQYANNLRSSLYQMHQSGQWSINSSTSGHIVLERFNNYRATETDFYQLQQQKEKSEMPSSLDSNYIDFLNGSLQLPNESHSNPVSEACSISRTRLVSNYDASNSSMSSSSLFANYMDINQDVSVDDYPLKSMSSLSSLETTDLKSDDIGRTIRVPDFSNSDQNFQPILMSSDFANLTLCDSPMSKISSSSNSSYSISQSTEEYRLDSKNTKRAVDQSQNLAKNNLLYTGIPTQQINLYYSNKVSQQAISDNFTQSPHMAQSNILGEICDLNTSFKCDDNSRPQMLTNVEKTKVFLSSKALASETKTTTNIKPNHFRADTQNSTRGPSVGDRVRAIEKQFRQENQIMLQSKSVPNLLNCPMNQNPKHNVSSSIANINNKPKMSIKQIQKRAVMNYYEKKMEKVNPSTKQGVIENNSILKEPNTVASISHQRSKSQNVDKCVQIFENNESLKQTVVRHYSDQYNNLTNRVTNNSCIPALSRYEDKLNFGNKNPGMSFRSDVSSANIEKSQIPLNFSKFNSPSYSTVDRDFIFKPLCSQSQERFSHHVGPTCTIANYSSSYVLESGQSNKFHDNISIGSSSNTRRSPRLMPERPPKHCVTPLISALVTLTSTTVSPAVCAPSIHHTHSVCCYEGVGQPQMPSACRQLHVSDTPRLGDFTALEEPPPEALPSPHFVLDCTQPPVHADRLGIDSLPTYNAACLDDPYLVTASFIPACDTSDVSSRDDGISLSSNQIISPPSGSILSSKRCSIDSLQSSDSGNYQSAINRLSKFYSNSNVISGYNTSASYDSSQLTTSTSNAQKPKMTSSYRSSQLPLLTSESYIAETSAHSNTGSGDSMSSYDDKHIVEHVTYVLTRLAHYLSDLFDRQMAPECEKTASSGQPADNITNRASTYLLSLIPNAVQHSQFQSTEQTMAELRDVREAVKQNMSQLSGAQTTLREVAPPHGAQTVERFCGYLEQTHTVSNLILSLCARVSRTERCLQSLSASADSDDQQLGVLTSKRDKLRVQLEEARALKDSIDRRGMHMETELLRCAALSEVRDDTKRVTGQPEVQYEVDTGGDTDDMGVSDTLASIRGLVRDRLRLIIHARAIEEALHVSELSNMS